MELLLASESREIGQHLLLFGVTITALFWGATPERAAIGVWWLCFELPQAIMTDLIGYQVNLSGIDPYLASKDITAAILWVWLALYANRNYTLWIAGVQLVAVGSHVARGMVEAISPIGYVFLVIVPGWMQLLTMALGFAFHIRRKKEYGPYRDWRIVRRPPDIPTLKPGKVA